MLLPSPAAEAAGFKTWESDEKVSITSRKGMVTINMQITILMV